MSDNQLKLNEQLFNVVLGKSSSLDVMLKKVKYLVRLGADLNANKKGDTLLFWAKKNNVSDEVIRVLEDMGAVSCSKTKEERVALARKCLDENKKFKSIEEVNFFIDEGADVNALDDKGECLLILAARMERNVDLPQPLAPRIPIHVPLCAVRQISRKTCFFLNFFEIFLISICIVFLHIKYLAL